MALGRAGINPPAFLLFIAIALVLLPQKAEAFGAGNIASVSAIEGKNWRHGDIEDTIKALAFIKGHKWTSMMVKRVYFGNWLRDYSQALDVGTLKSVQADTVRVLVWVLSFMGFGYATGEFEVTSERLGVYRPEEHIDNPKGYGDNQDARQYEPRLRGPIRQIELDIDPETGMKNYIANERGDWATSAGYVKYSLSRSIHFGRLYLSGGGRHKGKEEDLCEALRCLGQSLHTLEDWGAHTNYCELVLREMGMLNVFPHTGTNTMINLRGHHVFPVITGTFGMVDFLHSVLGEATDQFAQSEIDEMDNTLGNAQAGSSSSNSLSSLTGLMSKVPGMGDLASEAEQLKIQSQAQAQANQQQHHHQSHQGGYGGYGASRSVHDAGQGQGYNAPVDYSESSRASNSGPMPDIDPKKTISQIYPILVFRDKVVRRISSVIEKIPGLESLVEKISETLTVFIFSLLAPFIRPLMRAASENLHTGSSGVIDSSKEHQYEPWTDPTCTDPTHSFLSKDHFSNILNEPAGFVAAAILKYVVPRVLYAWQHNDVPVDRVLEDCVSVFHHPAVRDMNNEGHRTMFEAVQNWARSRKDGGANLDVILNADNVKNGKNHAVGANEHGHGLHSHGHGHGHGHSHGHEHGHGHGQGHAHQHHSNQHQHHQSHQHHQQHHQQHHSHSHGGSQGHSQGHSQGGFSNIPGLSSLSGFAGSGNSSSHQQPHSSGQSSSSIPWDKLSSLPIPGMSKINKFSSFIPGGKIPGSSRELDPNEEPSQGGHNNENNSSNFGNESTAAYASHTGANPPYSSGSHQQEQQQFQPGYDQGSNIPAPAGYEQYQQQGSGWNNEYQPPTHGSHTYDYYQGR